MSHLTEHDLADYPDQDLSAADRRRVRQHVTSCHECRPSSTRWCARCATSRLQPPLVPTTLQQMLQPITTAVPPAAVESPAGRTLFFHVDAVAAGIVARTGVRSFTMAT
jgi:anti-sigma factor RsiW